MTVEQVKVIIKDKQASIQSIKASSTVEEIPPYGAIEAITNLAKRWARERNLVFGSVNFDLIEKSRRARAEMQKGSS